MATRQNVVRSPGSITKTSFSAIAVVLLGLGLIGSGVGAQASPGASAAPGEDQVEASPAPIRESDREPERSAAVKTVADVKLRLTLDSWPLVAGEPAWITTKIKNDGRTAIRYSTDGCEIPVVLWGELLGERWRPVEPTDIAAIRAAGRNEALDFRWRVQEWTRVGSDKIFLDFVPKRFINVPDIGCLDIGIGHRVPPGGAVVKHYRWDGRSSGSFGPPPEGLARITGSFSFRRSGTAGRQSVEVQLDVPVTKGRDPDLLHPMEAVDAALADAGFRELIDGVNLGHRAEEMIVFDDRRGVWVVGACTDGVKWQGNWRAAAIVDGSSGDVRRVVERVTGKPCREGLWKG
jgi:hypothetical protein